MSDSLRNLETAKRYLKAIEDGNSSDLTAVFAPGIVMEQLPNRIYPNGLRASMDQMAAAFEKGRKLLSRQTYDIKNHVANGNTLALEVLWTGTLAVSFGTLAVGSQMRAHSAMFLEFENGKIARQRNYDCFEPW